MASSSKKKTTMAKLMREQRLRERRLQKQVRKDARKHAAAEDRDGVTGAPELGPSIDGPEPIAELGAAIDGSAPIGILAPAVEPAPHGE